MGVRSGLLFERVDRYPVQKRQFAPTALGNAIRRFETYARDRYKLDSQLLWHHLTAAAPDRAVAAVDNARTNVDFFVCLVYGGSATATLGIAVLASGHASVQSAVAIAAGIVIAIGCYRLALLATDEWNDAVRALVDHGWAGVAAAFGLHIPADFDSERKMWRAICTLVRRDYSYSEERDVAAIITGFRSPAEGVPSQTVASIGDGRPGIVQALLTRRRRQISVWHIPWSTKLVLATPGSRSRSQTISPLRGLMSNRDDQNYTGRTGELASRHWLHAYWWLSRTANVTSRPGEPQHYIATLVCSADKGMASGGSAGTDIDG